MCLTHLHHTKAQPHTFQCTSFPAQMLESRYVHPPHLLPAHSSPFLSPSTNSHPDLHKNRHYRLPPPPAALDLCGIMFLADGSTCPLEPNDVGPAIPVVPGQVKPRYWIPRVFIVSQRDSNVRVSADDDVPLEIDEVFWCGLERSMKADAIRAFRGEPLERKVW